MKINHTISHHFKHHHKKYFLGVFGGFAIIKTFVLLFGMFGITAFQLENNKAYAADAIIVRDGSSSSDRSDANNRIGGVVPGSTDIAIFNASATTNVSINTHINVKGIEIQSGYVGTIVQQTGYNITIGASGVIQSDGVVWGNSGNINIGGPYTIHGGLLHIADQTIFGGTIFMSGGAITGIAATFAGTPKVLVYTGGIIDINNITIYNYYVNDYSIVDIYNDLTLHNLTVEQYGTWGAVYLNPNNHILTIDGNIDLKAGALSTQVQSGTINFEGNTVAVKSTFGGGIYKGGNAPIDMNSNVSQTITVATGTNSPGFKIYDNDILYATTNTQFNGPVIMNGGSIEGVTTRFAAAPIAFEYTSGTINTTNITFGNPSSATSNVNLYKDLLLNNMTIDQAGYRWYLFINQNGNALVVSGDMSLNVGSLNLQTSNDFIDFRGNVLTVKSTFGDCALGGGAGKIQPTNSTTIVVETGAKSPVFINGISPIFNIYSGSHTYFGSDMNMSGLYIWGLVNLHSNTTSTRMLTPLMYTYSTEPIVDHVMICTLQDSYFTGLQSQSDWSCPGLSNTTYSSNWLSWGLGTDTIYDVIFNFVNNLGRITNKDYLLTPRHFKAPVQNGLADGTKNTLQLKVKFFTQP